MSRADVELMVQDTDWTIVELEQQPRHELGLVRALHKSARSHHESKAELRDDLVEDSTRA